jgi:hypothetical protein
MYWNQFSIQEIYSLYGVEIEEESDLDHVNDDLDRDQIAEYIPFDVERVSWNDFF